MTGCDSLWDEPEPQIARELCASVMGCLSESALWCPLLPRLSTTILPCVAANA